MCREAGVNLLVWNDGFLETIEDWWLTLEKEKLDS
jgi:hypothetical protein